jgi:hypothetical protein
MRVIGVLLIIAIGVLVGRAEGLRMTATAKQYVCTETFKAGLTSFFTEKDTKAAFAEDTTELCEMCAKVMRLAYLYSNDAQFQSKWPAALKSNACSYVSDARKADCNALTAGIVTAKQTFFDGKKSKFTRKELKGTTEQLGMLVDSRSYHACKQIGCCPVIPKRNGKPVRSPCSKPGDAASVSADRDQLQKDRFYLDKLREQLFVQRRDNNEFKAKLDLHEIDLKTREDKLKKDLKVLAEDQTKVRNAQNALKRRDERVARREEDEKKMQAFNKKKEKWLKERSDMVQDREDVCYKREEQLGIPHPPKRIPPPIPDAPANPPSRPPTNG